MAVEIGHLGQHHSDRTAGIGKPDRTAGTELSVQDSLDRSADRSAWKGESGKDRDDRTARR